jgi:putative Mg2+ transporter-C (MgtC) family protein
MSELEVIHYVSAKMFFAVVCGAVIGVDRELTRAPAGFKTHILICVGSMLFTVGPSLGDPSGTLPDEVGRVIAQIISGVGFLGAGAIMRSNSSHVIGLTTAAWIWFTAAVGILVGVGHGGSALFITSSLVAVIAGARQIERIIFKKVPYSSPRHIHPVDSHSPDGNSSEHSSTKAS